MRGSVCQKKLAEELPHSSHLGLLSDKTSVYGEKFEGFHVANETGKVLCLLGGA